MSQKFPTNADKVLGINVDTCQRIKMKHFLYWRSLCSSLLRNIHKLDDVKTSLKSVHISTIIHQMDSTHLNRMPINDFTVYTRAMPS